MHERDQRAPRPSDIDPAWWEYMSSRRVDFGKHVNKAYTEVPQVYLRWIRNERQDQNPKLSSFIALAFHKLREFAFETRVSLEKCQTCGKEHWAMARTKHNDKLAVFCDLSCARDIALQKPELFRFFEAGVALHEVRRRSLTAIVRKVMHRAWCVECKKERFLEQAVDTSTHLYLCPACPVQTKPTEDGWMISTQGMGRVRPKVQAQCIPCCICGVTMSPWFAPPAADYWHDVRWVCCAPAPPRQIPPFEPIGRVRGLFGILPCMKKPSVRAEYCLAQRADGLTCTNKRKEFVNFQSREKGSFCQRHAVSGAARVLENWTSLYPDLADIVMNFMGVPQLQTKRFRQRETRKAEKEDMKRKRRKKMEEKARRKRKRKMKREPNNRPYDHKKKKKKKKNKRNKHERNIVTLLASQGPGLPRKEIKMFFDN